MKDEHSHDPLPVSAAAGKTSLSPVARVGPIGWGVAAFFLCLLLYLLRLDSLAGAQVDDGWYMLLGKALATGQGYTLINSPSPGIVPLYPPAFPVLLSVGFRLFPSFPANVLILKVPSIVSLLLSGGLIYYYLVRIHEVNKKIAFGIALVTLVTPALVFLATSTLMSEVFFMFVQTATIVAVERSLRVAGKRVSWLLVIAAGCFASLTFLTRSIAVGLLLAVGLYFLLNRRVVYALVFSLVVCAFLGPWTIYKQRHAPTPTQVFEQQGYITTPSYAAAFWQNKAGDANSGTTPYSKLPQRVFIALSDIYGRDIGQLTWPALYRPSNEGGTEVFEGNAAVAPAAKVISCILGAFCLLGLISVVRWKLRLSELTLLCTLPLILTWPWFPFRFFVPFTPFIFLYLVSGINVVWRVLLRLLSRGRQGTAGSWKQKHDGGMTAPARLFLLFAILLNLYDHTNYILGRFHLVGSASDLSRTVGESDELVQWIRTNVEPNAVVATDNPPLLYLYTGLKTVSLSAPENEGELARRNVDYIVHFSPFIAWPALSEDESKQIVYRTHQFQFFVWKLKKP